jgi:hypothetical protein
MFSTFLNFWSMAQDYFVAACFLCLVWLIAKGVARVLWKLGWGLAKREIAIFAKNDVGGSLKKLLADTGIFNPASIRLIESKMDFELAKRASVLIVHWWDWKEDIDAILGYKDPADALLIYAPAKRKEDGTFDRIPDATMELLDNTRNTSVANFRGRLLNDLIATMIITSQQRGN